MNYNVIIPAAGEATRLRPLTNSSSKCMVNINGTPAISYILNSVYTEKMNECIIVTGKFNDVEEFINYSSLERIRTVKQGTLNGPKDAIRIAINNLIDKSLPIVVWLGDTILINVDISDYIEDDCLFVKENIVDQSQWAIVDPKTNMIYDKPKQLIENGLALVGVYVFKNGHDACKAFNQEETYNNEISSALHAYMNLDHTFMYEKRKTWYDIGTISSYHKTCASLLEFKTRAFNNISYNEKKNTLIKTSKRSIDLLAEINWYNALDDNQRFFVPKTSKSNIQDDTLELSYEPGILLSDLLISNNIAPVTFSYLLNRILDILEEFFYIDDCEKDSFEKNKITSQDLFDFWYNKAIERKACKETLETLQSYSRKYNLYDESSLVKCIHGDLHGGNIIYNPYNNGIVFIDPRGLIGNVKTTSGPMYYDLGKLSHDFYFGYNALLQNVEYPSFVAKVFENEMIKRGFDFEFIKWLGIYMLDTCKELHYTNPTFQEKLKDIVEDYYGK